MVVYCLGKGEGERRTVRYGRIRGLAVDGTLLIWHWFDILLTYYSMDRRTTAAMALDPK